MESEGPEGPEDPAQDGDRPETEEDTISSHKELKNALYARCANQPDGTTFTQDELLSYGIIPDSSVQRLQVFTRELTKEGLFKLMTKDNKVCWRVVKKEDAAKYKALTQEEAIVYSYIESSDREGIWTKLLRARTNFHMKTLGRILKSLEGKNYIKSIKSAKFPTRKTYILAKLQPSEDVTGGPFYTDGILDTEFIDQMSMWTERYIIGRSWYHPPMESDEHGGSSSSKKRKSNLKGASRKQIEDLRAEELQQRGPGPERSKHMLPMPPNYTGYPTTAEITRAINASGLSEVKLKSSETQQLVDNLYWDGRLEKVDDGRAWRASRSVAVETNGLTEAPCGACPVFDLCEDDGPVNARTCEYFQEWLAF